MFEFDQRARITIPDLVFILMSLAFFGALYPIFWSGFQENAAEISPAEGYLFQLILPLSIVVMLTIIWVKAAGGAS